jgi:hypothetical protein
MSERPTSPGSRWRERLPDRPLLACLGLCAVILIAATADLLHTESRLPDVSTPPCGRENATCRNAKLSEQLARDRAAEPLQDQYDSRAWLYAFAILAIAAVAMAYALRSRPRTRWLQVFTDLGATGVWLGIAAIVLLLATDGSSLAPPPAPTLMLPVMLLVAAAAGTLIGRSEGWSERRQTDEVRERVLHIGKLAIHIGTVGQARRSRLEELARLLSTVALGLAGVTCLLALIFVLAQPDCQSNGSPPGWTSPIDSVAAVTAIGGMAAGVGALLLRRWVVAALTLVTCPVALLLVLASTCAFY